MSPRLSNVDLLRLLQSGRVVYSYRDHHVSRQRHFKQPIWQHIQAHATQPAHSDIILPVTLLSSTPFGPALLAYVHVNISRHGWFDSYVNDVLDICLKLKIMQYKQRNTSF